MSAPRKAPPTPADFWRDAYQLAKDLHAIELRTLQGRIADLSAQLARLPSTGESLAQMNARIAAAMAEEETPGSGKKEENPLRKSNPTQWIMDSLEEEIPLSNEQARNTLRQWVDRQIRLRGQGSIDEILAEAVQGDVTDVTDEEEVEP